MIPEIAIAVLGLTAATLHLDSPAELLQCQPATFTWTSTVPPYILSVTLSDLQPTFNLSLEELDPWIEDSEMVVLIPEAHTATWIVDLPEGLNVTTHVKDGDGNVASGQPMVIGPGQNDYCLWAI